MIMYKTIKFKAGDWFESGFSTLDTALNQWSWEGSGRMTQELRPLHLYGRFGMKPLAWSGYLGSEPEDGRALFLSNNSLQKMKKLKEKIKSGGNKHKHLSSSKTKLAFVLLAMMQ